MRKLILLLTFQSSVAMLFAQTKLEPVKVTDLLKIKTVGNVTASADGSKVAYVVTSIEQDDSNKLDYRYVNQVYSISTAAGSTPVQLTTAKEGAQQPLWSPDGKQLAFVRNVSGKPQIFLLSTTGGEAVQLTRSKYGAANPKWSPDGRQILYASSVSLQDYLKDSTLNKDLAAPAWPSERAGMTDSERQKTTTLKSNPDGSIAEIRNYLAKNEADKKAIVLNKLNFQSETNISSDMNFNKFFVINVASAGEGRAITPGFYRFSNADFTPDGKQIIFSGDVDSLEHPDRSLESEIFIADANGNNLRMLLGEKGKTFSAATISLTGKWLAFIHGTTSFVSVPTLAIMPLSGTAKDIININYDRDKSNLTWSADEKYLYFTSNSNGGVILNRLDMNSRKVETLTSFDEGISSFDLVGSRIVYAKNTVRNPSELYMADASMKSEMQLTTLNDWVKTKQLSLPEKHTFKNEKGMDVEYWVMKPINYKAGQKYPLLLEIHGGPSAMWGPGERSMWHEFQYFTSQGYGVVYSNPRGSGGYGIDFLRGNINDWGAGPASDVLTALDKTVAEGWADKNKLLITGGSYAGYLTAWIISHDNRFAAACSQRGVYDLATFFGEGNAWRLVPNYFGGYPWEPKVKEVLVRESPITYVQNITTPYIIFHGANDRRTGFVQGEMMYRSLKVLNRPVEYVVHPGASHEITRTGDNRQRIDQMLRTYEFFQRWIATK